MAHTTYRNEPAIVHHRPHHRDFRPMRIIDGSSHPLGTSSTQRLLHAMLSRSDRPLKVVMNYGNLYLEDNDLSHSSYPYTGPSTTDDPNTVIYNAPGSTMAITSPGSTAGANLLRPRSPFIRTVSPTNGLLPITDVARYSSSDRRVVAMCLGCYKRQLVCSNGYCAECDFYPGRVTSTTTVPMSRMLTSSELYDDPIRTGYTIRHVRGARSPERLSSSPWRQDRDLDRELSDMRERQQERERFRTRERAWERKERDRRYTGNVGYYTSDYDLDGFV